jgi:hypothetical protein
MMMEEYGIMYDIPPMLAFKWVGLALFTIVFTVIVRKQNRALAARIGASAVQEELTVHLWHAQRARGHVVVVLWCLLVSCVILRDVERHVGTSEPVQPSATIAPAEDTSLDAITQAYQEAWVQHQMLVRCKQGDTTTLTRWRVLLQHVVQQHDADPTLAVRIEEAAHAMFDARAAQSACDAHTLEPIKQALNVFMHHQSVHAPPQ